MSWVGKSVLVTGAGGFIGSHLVERLVSLGATTKAFVHYRSDGSWGWLDRSRYKEDIEVLAGDVRDFGSVSSAIANTDVVFHLAALIAIPYSYRSPMSFVETNVNGTLNVLQACRLANVQRLVHTSTSEVYGTAQQVPISESHPLQAQSPYAASKIAADKLVESFHLSFGLPVVTVRPFNTFGPRQSSRAVTPTIIMQALTGDTVRLGNLHPTRDLNYVENIIDGFVRAALCKDGIGWTVNLGSGVEVSVGDLAKLIFTLVDAKAVIQVEGHRVRPQGSEVDRLIADNASAKERLDWEPAVSLEEGLRLTVKWMREHLHKYRPDEYVL
tara:strand:- start:1777 stop:2760 length:984 start_codon:yes stop_codon:yes gene_type:complete